MTGTKWGYFCVEQRGVSVTGVKLPCSRSQQYESLTVLFFKSEEDGENEHYSLCMLNFRLFISNFKLLSNQVFRFALSHSLRVKEQGRSLTIT